MRSENAASPRSGSRVALVHDFFVTPGGAEECAAEFADLIPGADIFTSFFDQGAFAARIDPARVRTWPLQRLGAPKSFRALFPLYAAYFGSLKLDADLVISSSIAFTKAVRTRAAADHISYVYTPMRYAWDLDSYLARSSYSVPAQVAARLIRPAMQRWDRRTAQRPAAIVAISEEVRRRIETVWNRSVDEVIYPPVPVHEVPLGSADDGYLLVAARLLAYRRIDIAVQACTKLGRRLIVVGDGPERERLGALAGPSVEFLGRVDRPRLLDLFSRAHAYLLPGAEDFGIAPVEAMAAGKPVVAFGAAGALETVVSGVSGVLTATPTAEAFADAITELDRVSWDPAAIRAHASRFGSDVFRARWRDLLERRGFGDVLAPAR